jgi:hypothetical protein
METTYTTLEHKGQPKEVRGIDRQLLFGRVSALIRRIDQGFWMGKGNSGSGASARGGS